MNREKLYELRLAEEKSAGMIKDLSTLAKSTKTVFHMADDHRLTI